MSRDARKRHRADPPTLFRGIFNATARKARRLSKESQTLQQGKPNATARKAKRYSKESRTPQQGKPDATCGILFLLLSEESTKGAKDHRRGCQPPGQVSLTIVSPGRATEYVTCLITTCLWLCRPLGAFSVVASLPGVITPVCGLSSLRDFWQAPISCYSSETPIGKNLKGRERIFPRTAIVFLRVQKPMRRAERGTSMGTMSAGVSVSSRLPFTGLPFVQRCACRMKIRSS